MSWRIVEQTERVAKEEIPVRVKQIRFLPTENGGETRFVPLRFVLLQMIVQNDRGNQVRIKWNNHGGMPGRFSVQQPDTEDYPTFTVGQGKTRKVVPDTLAKKVRIPGKKWNYDSPEDFVKDNRWLNGLHDEILTEFAKKIAATAY